MSEANGTTGKQAALRLTGAWLLSVVVGALPFTVCMGLVDESSNFSNPAAFGLYIVFSLVASIPYALIGLVGINIVRGMKQPVHLRRQRFFFVLKAIVLVIFFLISVAAGSFYVMIIPLCWGVPGLIIELLILKERHFEPKQVAV